MLSDYFAEFSAEALFHRKKVVSALTTFLRWTFYMIFQKFGITPDRQNPGEILFQTMRLDRWHPLMQKSYFGQNVTYNLFALRWRYTTEVSRLYGNQAVGMEFSSSLLFQNTSCVERSGIVEKPVCFYVTIHIREKAFVSIPCILCILIDRCNPLLSSSHNRLPHLGNLAYFLFRQLNKTYSGGSRGGSRGSLELNFETKLYHLLGTLCNNQLTVICIPVVNGYKVYPLKTSKTSNDMFFLFK